MTHQDREFLRRLSVRLLGKQGCPKETARNLIWLGGHDMTNLSEDDVDALIAGEFRGDWREVAFSFGELLAYYAVAETDSGRSQVADWATATIIVADAVSAGSADLDLQMPNFMRYLTAIREYLDAEETAYILTRIAGGRLGFGEGT